MVSGNVRAILLAAGRSSRFKRKQSKLATTICGQPMVLYPLKELQKLRIPATMILGYQSEEIKLEVEKADISNVDFVLQQERLGTGHAVMCSRHTWDREHILILNGDMPLLKADFLERLVKKHTEKNAAVSFVATHVLEPSGYGRVIETNGRVLICEEKDCPSEYLNEKKVNAGIYLVKRTFLEKFITTLKKSEASGEFYITDLIAYASDEDTVNIVQASFDEVRGVNTLHELWAVEQIMRSNIIKYWMDRGVRFDLAQNVHIDRTVEIGPDSNIGAGVQLRGKTKIGEGCTIDPFSIIKNTLVGDGTTIYSHSVIDDSVVGRGVHIGPFARLRNQVEVADNAAIGNFVEIKKSKIGNLSKAKHLTYIGDTTVGTAVNIGAGTIVCNYDGKDKHKTIINDRAFIGSNNTLVAPLEIGKGAYTAAGSTINKDVPGDDLAIGRARQENKKGYAKKIREKRKKIKVNFLGAIKTHGGTEESL